MSTMIYPPKIKSPDWEGGVPVDCTYNQCAIVEVDLCRTASAIGKPVTIQSRIGVYSLSLFISNHPLGILENNKDIFYIVPLTRT